MRAEDRGGRGDTLNPERPADAGRGTQAPRQPGKTVVAVDAMGGDNAPREIVAGALTAVREHGIGVILTGRLAALRPLLESMDGTAQAGLATADDTLGMDEGALASWRRPRSSVAVACQLVRRGQAAAVVSAGSTGGVVATASLRLRSLPGVVRPVLAVVLPTSPTPAVLVDAGATADPKPEMLVQFAHLGVAYAQVALGISEPRVGLLNIGAEPGKGNRLTRRAHELLAAAAPQGGLPIRFAGNIEGGDLLAGKVDVIVTDGFTGNVALKTVEGMVSFTTAQVREALTGTPVRRLAALAHRRGLRELAERLDSETYGGAALLGLTGTVVIAHGAARAPAVTSACRLAAALAEGQIAEKIRERLGSGRGGSFLRRSARDRDSLPPQAATENQVAPPR